MMSLERTIHSISILTVTHALLGVLIINAAAN